MDKWKVNMTRYQGRKVIALTFGQWDSKRQHFTQHSVLFPKNPWTPEFFEMLADQIEIEEGR